MRPAIYLILAAAAMATAPLSAQLGLPQMQTPVLDPAIGVLRDTLPEIESNLGDTARRLLETRARLTDRLLRKHRDSLELDARGQLSRKGELLIENISAGQLAELENEGFLHLETVEIEGLDLRVTRLGLSKGTSLAEGEARIRQLVPDARVSADNIHFTAGAARGGSTKPNETTNRESGIAIPMGIIDGAPGPAIATAATKGFAKGAPYPSHHGSAIASLLRSQGARNLRVADVYGTDPAGGGALAIARALGWLVGGGTKVITISLVGPENPLLARAVATAQRKGAVVVAAVGNDGPAAPPAYPASYDGVIAVTGVDRKGRGLIEAGRAKHLDYAAPGADVYALNAKGKMIRLRGTSFATPLVAARAAHAMRRGGNWIERLDREARDLGKPGPDPVFGRGLLCSDCGRK